MYLYVQCIRITDHSWRSIIGLPHYRYSQITPTLYLGGQYRSYGLQKLKRMGITGIINMRETPILNTGYQNSFRFLHLPTKDHGAPTLTQLSEGVNFIERELQQKGKVYVHCHWGEGRGPTMVLAYLIYTGMVIEDAILLVKGIRPFIRPTAAQLAALKQFQHSVNSI